MRAVAPRRPRLLDTHVAPLLASPAAATHPVARVLLERRRVGWRRGADDDGHRVAVAVEGGGMGGAVSGGMCVALEALGLVDCVDLLVGCSAGALNAAWTAAGQAAQGATNYEDLAGRAFINRWRLLTRRPVIDFDLLFEGLARSVKPLSAEGLARGPELVCVATSFEDGRARVLNGLRDPSDAVQAARASCALPVLGGPPRRFRGELMADGGLVEPIPYRTALACATHVLVLRSRDAARRKARESRLARMLAGRTAPALAELLEAHPDLYNRDAETLERGADPALRDRLLQIAPEPGEAVSRLEARPAAVVAGLQAGAEPCARLFASEPVALHWQPRAYRTETWYSEAPAWRPPAPRRLPAERARLRSLGS